MRRQSSAAEPLLSPVAPPAPVNPLGPFPPPPLGLETDPFYVFRDELGLATRTALVKFDKWLDLFTNTSTADVLFMSENASLRKSLSQLAQNAAHLERVVSHVERKRADFPAITDQDLTQRRTFLQEVQRRLQNMNATISSPETIRKMEADRLEEAEARRRARSAAVAPAVRVTAAARDEEEGLDGAHLQSHESLLRAQDEVLDDISSSLGTLHSAGREIHEEVTSQNRMLDEMASETTNVMGGLEGAMGRLDKVLHASSRGQTCAVVFLVVVLLVLIVLVSVL